MLGLLAHGPVDLPARQLSMRATMSWSYQLLDGTQQTLFRRLGVFPGSFCLDAAEHVCTGIGPDGDWLAPDALLDGIAALVDLHLIEPMPDVRRREPGGCPVHACSGAPRAYAVELLEMSGEDSGRPGPDARLGAGLRPAGRARASPRRRAALARPDR